MEKFFCGALGFLGGLISTAFGGWTMGMTTLIICMAIDYITGLICAGVFKKSKKTETGGLESKAGWKGLCKKGITLLIVLISCRIDILLGTNFVRDAVVIAYVINEILSIIENAGSCGVPIPKVLRDAIDMLRKQADEEEEKPEDEPEEEEEPEETEDSDEQGDETNEGSEGD